MNTEKTEILDRIYQSYIMGGDVYTYNFNTLNPSKIEHIKNMLTELESEQYFKIKSINEKKARLEISDKGIDFGNRG